MTNENHRWTMFHGTNFNGTLVPISNATAYVIARAMNFGYILRHWVEEIHRKG